MGWIEKFSDSLKEEYQAKELEEILIEGEKTSLDIEEPIKGIFESRGIASLYKFQMEAIKKEKEGKNVIITAPTASGKTEVFLYKAISNALQNKTTLVVYPTKALSRDQLKRFSSLALYGISSAIYDGDSTQSQREKIKSSPPSILITNFDMLHFILMQHKKFSKFFESLETIVIDEFHIYSGVFGSHVGNIIQRLKRITQKAYKKSPQFVLTSATIANPKEFAESMVNESFELIEGKGKEKHITHLIISPDESYLTAVSKIAKLLDRKCLIFANSHASVERLGLIAKSQDLNLFVYRAGFSKKHREDLEHLFKSKENIMLASTSALELGIDIGDISTVMLAGFAGSITSARQRLGRAGRKGRGLAIFISRESPLDVYYAEHPEEYIYNIAESCYANSKNNYIRKPHLVAMAKDMLLRESELDAEDKIMADALCEENLLKKFGNFYSPTKEGVIFSRKMSIRGAGQSISIIDEETNKEIGSREKQLAISELYEGAIYLHGGKTYICKKLDLEQKKAYVSRQSNEENIYTKSLSDKTAEVLEIYKTKDINFVSISLGKVKITNMVHGFLVKDIYSNQVLGENSFNEPYVHETVCNAFWLDFLSIPEMEKFGEGLHGFEHVAISMSPLLTGSDDKELGGISYPTGRMYIYEGIEGGIGLADVIFERFAELNVHVKKRLFECPCTNGCPRCILDPACGNDNKYLSKEEAKKISLFLFNELNSK